MKLKKKLKDKTAKIGVIGLGYVGLPLAIEFVQTGYNVVGIDVDESKNRLINSGKNYIKDIDDNILKKSVENNKFSATSDFSLVKEMDSISICVPTPLNKQKDPDISYIISVMEKIKSFIHEDMLIVLESTTYPGSTKELILPYLNSSGFSIGKNIFLCFSPERIDPGNKDFNTRNTPKVIGGVTKDCAKIGRNLYKTIVNKVVMVSSTETAEMVKLLENTFRAINIGLANEIAIMCEKLGVNAWEVIDAAATKPFGFMKFTPGPGLGGHCIPIDPHYLSWKLKTLDYEARFIQLAGEINTNMPNHVLNLISINLNNNEQSLNGSKIIIFGVAYKRDINDVRESPAIDIIQLLINAGAKVDYHDKYVPKLDYDDLSMRGITGLNNIKLNSYDACVIITDHSNVDYELIYNHCHLIIDTRNVFHDKDGSHIKRLGQG
ncbi:MAG: UDP-N-acetyl-D-glucosamine dehydrogenase [Pelagibacteraceae bacterium]|nr:UDP-N-acetyl-D-glucosamine dehydrogenase [Pelagibacteraceae bacterium]|tara:strand:- start:21739 stop:23046 length:1308 start_codon:yes stop_codon:yes gene_type:complete